jgi:ornithine cyclodeaminase
MTGAFGPITIRAADLFRSVSWRAAVDALLAALSADVDPSVQPARSAVPTNAGELLLMPAEWNGMAGVKVASVAPANPKAGLPRVQGIYVLMDSATLSPRALLDAAALTTLRTPALSAVAVDALAPSDANRLLVFGAGPQAEGHVHALRAVRPLDDVRIVARTNGRAAALVDRLARDRIAARVGSADDVSAADVIVTATTSPTAVIDARAVSDHTVFAAVGSHSPGHHELPHELIGRSDVIVENRPTALTEAGDVVNAMERGCLSAGDLVEIHDLVRNDAHPARHGRRARPAVFKSVGQGWQDLVVATVAFRATQRADA